MVFSLLKCIRCDSINNQQLSIFVEYSNAQTLLVIYEHQASPKKIEKYNKQP